MAQLRLLALYEGSALTVALCLSIALVMHASLPMVAGRFTPDLIAGSLAVAVHVFGASLVIDPLEAQRFGAYLSMLWPLTAVLHLLVASGRMSARRDGAEGVPCASRSLIARRRSSP